MLAFIAGMARELANSEIFSGCFVFVFRIGVGNSTRQPLYLLLRMDTYRVLFSKIGTLFSKFETLFQILLKVQGRPPFFSPFSFFFLLTVNAVVYCLLFLARLYCFQQSFSFSLHFLIFFIYIFSIKPGDLHPGTNAVRIKCRL